MTVVETNHDGLLAWGQAEKDKGLLGVWGGGGVLKFVKCFRIIFYKAINLLFILADGRVEMSGNKPGHFCERNKCTIP